ncbi:MAG TPA: phosphoenolpyruvate--protein phosphotransferase [Steroidobacteraceae bacterium]
MVLKSPLAGWSTPLEEVPDEAFAARMLGDGVAIDPTHDTLHAPCDAEVIAIAAAHHALTLRTPQGCEILLHVGLDTVALQGTGFEILTRLNTRVRAGDPLLRFDLDFLAQHARSLLTPVIVSLDSRFRIVRRALERQVQVGEFLLELEPTGAPATADAPAAAAPAQLARVAVTLAHGLHARPAARLAAALRNLNAQVRIAAHGREANALSTVALMGLGVSCGEEVEVRVSGTQAPAALEAVRAALTSESAAHAARSVPAPPVPVRTDLPAGVLGGVIASRGFAVGPIVQLRRVQAPTPEQGAGAEAETAALAGARDAVRERLARRAGAGDAVDAAREIARAHLELLDDPELLQAAQARIAQGKAAGFAWRQAIRAHTAVLGALEDARLRERVDDLLDLETQVLAALHPAEAPALPPLPAGAIIVARELLPSQLVALDGGQVGGICTAEGGATSHVAILASAMGIPALAALGAQVLGVPEGSCVVLDAEHGFLEQAPSAQRLAAARALVAQQRAAATAAQAAAQGECRTRDGTRIQVLANVGSVAEARAAVRNGAEGCGLLRTEFLFLDRQSAPTPAEQTHTYQQIADALGARPLTVRTLDAGGDKPIAYLKLPAEANPALGLRGVRTSLAYPQLLHDQLRAILAVAGPAQCRLLLPMITDVTEVAQVRSVLDAVQAEFPGRPAMSVGVMIETPASAVLAGELAQVADFLSIGTNDLTQYVLAMDRLHPQLAARLDALHPAVLALIARAAQAAHAHGRHAAVCGALASEPDAAPLLVGLGVDELSAVPGVIPQVKAQIARFTLAQCRALAQQALQLQGAPAVRKLLAAHAQGVL